MRGNTVLIVLLVTCWLITEAWDYGMPTLSLAFLGTFLYVWTRGLPASVRSRLS
jgi:hypothetical protein